MFRTDGGYGVPGMPGNHAGVRDLVYRGEPVQAMPMPYYGGGMNIQTLAQGIPVGQDPRFPMDQDMFRTYVDERRLQNRFSTPGSFLKYVDEFNKSYFPGGQSSLPPGVDAKYVS